MLSPKQYDEIKAALDAQQNDKAITLTVEASNGKGSKNAAWGALEEFHELANISCRPEEWAGYGRWPDTKEWAVGVTAYFN